MGIEGLGIALERPLEGFGVGSLRERQYERGHSRHQSISETHGVLPIEFLILNPHPPGPRMSGTVGRAAGYEFTPATACHPYGIEPAARKQVA